MRLFVDRNYPKALAHCLDPILRNLGGCAVSSYDRYARDPGDVAWMRELGAEGGWSVLTRDNAIRRNPAELREWRSSGLIVFFSAPGWGKLPLDGQAWRLIKRLPELVRVSGTARPGTGFAMPVNGALQRMFFRAE